MKIAILGAGVYGTALGGVLANNGYDIDYYDPLNEKEQLSKVLDHAQFVVLAMPSAAVPYTLPHLPSNLPLIIASKGFLSTETFDLFSDYMVISGPSFAEDIKNAKPVSFTVTDPRLLDLFKADYITFDTTDDIKGVLLCGALKNVYAILAGYKNLERDSKKWRSFIDDAATEMKEILALNDADPRTVDLYCGVPDLELTCGLPSRNFSFGLSLKDRAFDSGQTVEGLTALKRITIGEIEVPDSALLLKEILEIIEANYASER